MNRRQALRGKLRRLLSVDALGKGLFWAWNLAFVCFMLLGFAPALLPEVVPHVLSGDLPWPFLGLVLGLTLLPIAVSLLGYAWLRRSGRGLLALGFGFEGPLMALLALRFFGVREANPAMALLLAIMVLGLAGFLWQLLDRRLDERGAVAQGLRWLLLCLLAAVGGYLGVWAAFYLLPGLHLLVETGAELLQDLPGYPAQLWRELAREPWYKWPFIVLVGPVALFTGLLIVALPAGSLAYWFGGIRRAYRAARQTLRPSLAGSIALVALLGLPLLFLRAARQPQLAAFQALARPPADRAAMLARKAQDGALREGLLNALLAGKRYLGARGGIDHVRRAYRDLPWIAALEDGAEGGRRPLPESVQAAYEWWVSPLLYQPAEVGLDGEATTPGNGDQALTKDPIRAAQLYQDHFDAPMMERERAVVARTVAANWNLAQGAMDRLAVDDREVLVTERALRLLAADGGWAELELHEAYQNQTTQQQEVTYAFSLPEAAVITGLWLGASEDPATRQAFAVAPRGAAQQVYREERTRRLDPALVEQLGPRQYRLRVFPVPPQVWTGEEGWRARKPGAPLHLWLTFAVPATQAAGAAAEGGPRWAWPLPRLTEARNAYWNRGTRWTLPAGALPPADDAWLPAELAADPAAATPRAARMTLAGWELAMEPADGSAGPDGDPSGSRPVGATGLPSQGGGPSGSLLAADGPLPRRPAVWVDRSRSMEAQAGALAAELDRLRDLEATGRLGEVTLYLSAPKPSGQAPERLSLAALQPDQLWAYGGQDPAELLAELDRQSASAGHDAVLVLSDASAFVKPAAAAWTGGPLWWVHLGGAAPSYPDALQDALLTSGGGTAGSVVEALRRWQLRAAAPTGAIADEVDGWRVTLRSLGEGAEAAGTAGSPGGAGAGTGSAPAAGGAAAGAAAQLAAAGPATASKAAGLGASPLRKVAARQVLQAEARRLAAAAPPPASLDALHRLAVAEGIVSPFSSMIVLVNDAQRKRLEDLSKGADRFEREVEAGGADDAAALVVTAVPEPEEWLLLAVALLLLAVKGRGWAASGARRLGA